MPLFSLKGKIDRRERVHTMPTRHPIVVKPHTHPKHRYRTLPQLEIGRLLVVAGGEVDGCEAGVACCGCPLSMSNLNELEKKKKQKKKGKGGGKRKRNIRSE